MQYQREYLFVYSSRLCETEIYPVNKYHDFTYKTDKWARKHLQNDTGISAEHTRQIYGKVQEKYSRKNKDSDHDFLFLCDILSCARTSDSLNIYIDLHFLHQKM